MSPTHYPVESQQRSGLLPALVIGALIALVAANIYLYVQIDHLRSDLGKTNEALSHGLSNLKDASSVTAASQQRHIDNLKEQLAAQMRAAENLSGQAKADAIAKTEQLKAQFEAEQARLGSEIKQAEQKTDAGLTAANSKIADVASDVGNVRTQATQTQDQLSKTIADLKSVTGDLGVQSGLIATNARELAALRLKGERNYTDIKLGKTKQPVRFADIALRLDSVNPKKNTYSLYVHADDKQVYKRDKAINEPVQFYTIKGGHTPYELVINQVTKDSIVGYLSTPKETTGR